MVKVAKITNVAWMVTLAFLTILTARAGRRIRWPAGASLTTAMACDRCDYLSVERPTSVSLATQSSGSAAVGRPPLANVLPPWLEATAKTVLVAHVTCDGRRKISA